MALSNDNRESDAFVRVSILFVGLKLKKKKFLSCAVITVVQRVMFSLEFLFYLSVLVQSFQIVQSLQS